MSSSDEDEDETLTSLLWWECADRGQGCDAEAMVGQLTLGGWSESHGDEGELGDG